MDVVYVSESITKDLENLLVIIFLVSAIVILPLYVAYYFYRWCRYRTLWPLLIIMIIFFGTTPIVAITNAAIYGSNLDLAMIALTMLVVGDILIFCAWVAGQIYRLAIGKSGRIAMDERYKISGFAKDSIGEHHLMIAAVSPFPFILFSVLQFKWLKGAVSGVVSAFWYMSILFYLSVAIFIAVTWFMERF